MVRPDHQAPRAGLLALLVLGLGAPVFAQTSPVTLAWEANPDPSVAGYVVYVGNASGLYHEQYAVGDRTSFVYDKATSGRPYFFAVASYSAGFNVGSPSEEVFFLAGAVPQAQAPPSDAAPAASGRTTRAQCAGAAEGDCLAPGHLATLNGDASALTPVGDGRLFFIEDRRRIRVITGDLLIEEPALGAGAISTQFAGLALDPGFARNRFVYVGEVETRADGARTLSVVRYREVQNVLAEGAALIAGLALPPLGDAPFAVDSAQRIYVAVPGPPDGQPNASPYEGMVLRFENDGTVSDDSRAGSPVLARGPAKPVSLFWNSAGNELWLAGSDVEWTGMLARIPLSPADSADWPRAANPTPAAEGSPIVALSGGNRTRDAGEAGTGSGTVLLVDEAGGLFRIGVQPGDGLAAERLESSPLAGEPTSAALEGGYLYVGLRVAEQPFSSSFQIVRFRRD